MSRPEPGVERFARHWAQAVVGIGFRPMSAVETGRLLAEFTATLAGELAGESFCPAAVRRVGAALVEANFTDPAVLESTLRLLAERHPDLSPVDDARLAAVQAALASGYAGALRSRTLTEQERLSQSIMDALGASEARFRAIFDSAAVGIGIAGADGRIVHINRAFADMLGYDVAELRRRDIVRVLHGDDRAATERYARVLRGGTGHARSEELARRRDGSPVWTDLTVSLIRHGVDDDRYTVTLVEDITERRQLRERLRHQALHDPLTGLANRRFFAERIEAAFAAAGPVGRIGLCVLDLDRFKEINDSYGHLVGDQLLATVASRLDGYASARGHLVARMGGDEFMILVDPSSGAEQLVDLARVIVSALAGTVQVGVHRLQVTASVGVAEQVATTTSPAELIQAADVTLRWAKADGRARWAIFDPERHAEQSARHRLAGEMSGAIDHDEFVLEYQPLVGLGDHEVRGVEALVRWLHPRLGLLSPDRFIGLAEESGLIVRLGLWILRRACAEAARWRREHPERSFFVSVNLAVRQVHEPNLVDEVASILRETGLAASDLQLELTESAVMGTGGEPLQALWRLAEMGVRIAIDDFGTGYSNLAYLRHLPVHALKLAGPFVEGLRHTGPESSTDERIVENVIRLAHDIGLGVTAEAVETRVQLDRLAALGCDLAQGWYLARALPADEVTAVLRSGLPIVP